MTKWIIVGLSVMAVVFGCLLLVLTFPWGGAKVQFTVESIDIRRPASRGSAICFSAHGTVHKAGYDASFSAPAARLYKKSLLGKSPVVSTDDLSIEVGKTYAGLLFYDRKGNIDGILPTSEAFKTR